VIAMTRPADFCVFSPDGRRIAGACDDGKLRVWDVKPSMAPPASVSCGGGGSCDGHGDAVTDKQIASYIARWIASTPN
jgi:WD40 repeat protein